MIYSGMSIATAVVSRKTPRDGRLEIAAETADHLAALGPGLTVAVGGEVATASVETMACACAKGEAGHLHRFLASAPLRGLAAGTEVALHVDDAARRVTLRPTTKEP